MGLQDRDYYRDIESAGAAGLRSRSIVTILIIINVAVYLAQILLFHSHFPLTPILGCSAEEVFRRGHIWQLLTANFLHSEREFWHIVGNMLFLYYFGRDLESIFGKRDFLIFYLAAGIFGMFCQAGIDFLRGVSSVTVGASAGVSGIVILFTFFFPRREILLFGVLPIQAWLLCILFVLYNITGAIGNPMGAPVAYWAHLGGSLVGALYRFVDLRWGTIASKLSLRKLRNLLPGAGGGRVREARRPARVIPFKGPASPLGERDEVSERIDQLLEKISRHGKSSLSEDELEYLKENSQFYKSH